MQKVIVLRRTPPSCSRSITMRRAVTAVRHSPEAGTRERSRNRGVAFQSARLAVARFPGRGRRLPTQPALYARPRPGLARQTQPSRELSQAAVQCCTVEAHLSSAGVV
jgi:hypothetical protein